jgi:capsular polysaccharide biosynthesis protein
MLDRSHAQAPFELDDQASLDPLYYYEILKKRKFYGLIPFVCVLAIGSAVTMLWPPIYQSEGKILVESQQIPIDLVRPTVTASASERVATIQQRVLTRDNLLKIADKYQIFADQSSKLSRTDMLDLMRANTIVKPVELGVQNQIVTVAVTVGFTDRRPHIATNVANELITLFLTEDARNRTNRATETTKFLEQEVKKLQSELASIDEKLIRSREQTPGTVPQLGLLKLEYSAKSAVFSPSHPEVRRLKAQIEALEKEGGEWAQGSPAPVGGYGQLLDPLVLQRMSVQSNLESTSQKLAAARRGESLERDQFSERLEVLEQAIPPQRPIRPNRPKLLALAFFAAVAAGFASIFTIETIDKTIRNKDDLMTVANGQLIVEIPYLATKAELQNKKSRIVFLLGILAASLLVGLIAIHFMLRPLDELWPILLTRLGF